MSRIENESRSTRSGGDPNGGRGEPFRILRLYSLERKDPKKPGPPRKTLQLILEHLPAEVGAQIREQIEAQLRPQQVLELDGTVVARGADVGPEEIEAAPELKSDLGEAYMFAHRMLWEVYERETAAIDRLSERSADMFKRNLELTAQLHRAIQESLEIQAALRAIFEGETMKKEPRASSSGATKGDDEEVFNVKNIKDWVQGLGTLRDVMAEVTKMAREFKASQGAAGSNGEPAP